MLKLKNILLVSVVIFSFYSIPSYAYIPSHAYDTAVRAYDAARAQGLDPRHILTIVDFDLPSNDKRLWVINMADGDVLYHTYVTNGHDGGFAQPRYFSNNYGSHESSLGLYLTGQRYYGSIGLSMHVFGLDAGFNDHAYNRAIEMHGAWYADPKFIDEEGRMGRSWGCFALPAYEVSHVINLIDNGTLLFAYYPDDYYLNNSIFLNPDLMARETNGGHLTYLERFALNHR